MAILMLAERNKLSLDDPLVKFFPDLPSADRNIKIRHLLNHTSGIINYESLIPDTQTVQVLDKDSGRDLTAATMALIIFEEEKKTPKLGIAGLRKIIQTGQIG